MTSYYQRNKEKVLTKKRLAYEKSGKIIQIGEIFYKLEVISQAESEITISSKGKQSHRRMWNVRCECGKEFRTSGTKLRRADIVMCVSCANKLRPQSAIKFTGEEVLFKKVILARAKKSNIPVSINENDFILLATQNCHYCDAPPKERSHFNMRQISIKINGIDRIDNKLGYHKENCVACCTTCNTMKASLGYDEFYKHIYKIVKNKKEKENAK